MKYKPTLKHKQEIEMEAYQSQQAGLASQRLDPAGTANQESPIMTARNMIVECAERLAMLTKETVRISATLFGEPPGREGEDSEKAQPRTGDIGALLDTVHELSRVLGDAEHETKELSARLLLGYI